MERECVTRAILAAKGEMLGIQHDIQTTGKVSGKQIAETIEAIIGAVYVDSGKQHRVVAEVITTMKLDDHHYLREPTYDEKPQRTQADQMDMKKGAVLTLENVDWENEEVPAEELQRRPRRVIVLEKEEDSLMQTGVKKSGGEERVTEEKDSKSTHWAGEVQQVIAVEAEKAEEKVAKDLRIE